MESWYKNNNTRIASETADINNFLSVIFMSFVGYWIKAYLQKSIPVIILI